MNSDVQNLIEHLKTPDSYKKHVKLFRNGCIKGEEDKIDLVIKAVSEIIVDNANQKPMALLNSIRLIKETTVQDKWFMKDKVSEMILPQLIQIAQYDIKNKQTDRGKTYFSKEPTQEQQVLGNSFLRLILECIMIWGLWHYPSEFYTQYEYLKSIGVAFPNSLNYFKDQRLEELVTKQQEQIEQQKQLEEQQQQQQNQKEDPEERQDQNEEDNQKQPESQQVQDQNPVIIHEEVQQPEQQQVEYQEQQQEVVEDNQSIPQQQQQEVKSTPVKDNYEQESDQQQQQQQQEPTIYEKENNGKITTNIHTEDEQSELKNAHPYLDDNQSQASCRTFRDITGSTSQYLQKERDSTNFSQLAQSSSKFQLTKMVKKGNKPSGVYNRNPSPNSSQLTLNQTMPYQSQRFTMPEGSEQTQQYQALQHQFKEMEAERNILFTQLQREKDQNTELMQTIDELKRQLQQQ